jgi:hypothetical protein
MKTVTFNIECERCKVDVEPILERRSRKEYSDLVKASCPLCGRYIRFVSPKDARVRVLLREWDGR